MAVPVAVWAFQCCRCLSVPGCNARTSRSDQPGVFLTRSTTYYGRQRHRALPVWCGGVVRTCYCFGGEAPVRLGQCFPVVNAVRMHVVRVFLGTQNPRSVRVRNNGICCASNAARQKNKSRLSYIRCLHLQLFLGRPQVVALPNTPNPLRRDKKSSFLCNALLTFSCP